MLTRLFGKLDFPHPQSASHWSSKGLPTSVLLLSIGLFFAGPAKAQLDSIFMDATPGSGLDYVDFSWGSAWGDGNGDGYPDLFVGNHWREVDRNRPFIFINNQDGTFTRNEVPDFTNVVDMHGAGWIDYDNDGDEDLFITTGKASRNFMLINDGAANFVERADSLGLTLNKSRGRGAMFVDMDRNGRLDFITCAGPPLAPFEEPTRISLNFADTGFLHLGEDSSNVLGTLSATGGTLADLSGDGQLDLMMYDLGLQPVFGAGCIPLEVIQGFDVTPMIEGLVGDYNGDLLPDVYMIRNEQGQSTALDEYPINLLDAFGLDTIDRSTVGIISPARFGSVGLFDATVVYRPLIGFTGRDSVKVGYCDVVGNCEARWIPFLVVDSLPGGSYAPTGELYVEEDSNIEVDVPLYIHPYRHSISLVLKPETNIHSFRFRVDSDTLLVDQVFPFFFDPANIFIGSGAFNPDDFEFVVQASDPATHGFPALPPGAAQQILLGYNPADSTWTFGFNSDNNSQRIRSYIYSPGVTEIIERIGFDDDPFQLQDQLLVNTGGGYTDQTAIAGLDDPNDAIGGIRWDFDNDMDLDIFLSCGLLDGNDPNRLYENQGDGTFVEVAAAGGASEPAVEGVAGPPTCTDFNRDGFFDLFVENGRDTRIRGPYKLFENRGNSNHWIVFNLNGTVSNRDAIGSTIICYAGGKAQIRYADGGMHRYAQDWHRAHFGLGPNTMVDSVYIRWPSGAEETFYGIPADQYLSFDEPVGGGLNCFPPAKPQSMVNLPGGVMLSWEPTNCAEGYKVFIRPSDTVPYSNYPVADTSTVIPGRLLELNSTYTWYVQPICSDSSLGGITQLQQFNTNVPCPAPSGLVTEEYLPDSIRLVWNPVAEARGFTLYYKRDVAPGFSSVNVRNLSFRVNGSVVQPGRTYNWFVRSNCALIGAGDSSAVQSWTAPVFRQAPIPKLSILPNPVSQELRIEGLQDPFAWQLMDAFGKVVARGAGEGTTAVSVLDLPPGSYTLHWVSDAVAASGAESVLIMR